MAIAARNLKYQKIAITGTGANATVSHNLGSTPTIALIQPTAAGATDHYVVSKSPSSVVVYVTNLKTADLILMK